MSDCITPYSCEECGIIAFPTREDMKNIIVKNMESRESIKLSFM